MKKLKSTKITSQEIQSEIIARKNNTRKIKKRVS